MSAAVVLLTPLVALLATMAGGRALRTAVWVAPLVPLALLVPLAGGEAVDLPPVLLGMRLGADDVTLPVLALTALAWGLAGWLARDRLAGASRSFWIGWYASLLGMALALLAQNLSAFYAGYVVVSLSAYLMVVESRTAAAFRAGRVYLVMAIAGEAAILSGVILIAGRFGNVEFATLLDPANAPARAAAAALFLAGFAVKLGIIPLHFWLPLAHPIAPVPASAILSGVIVKAGLVGWLRLAPAPGLEGPRAGWFLLVLGLLTAFGGVLLGLTQLRLKTVLAYSTVSQMGLVLAGFSAGYLGGASAGLVATTLGLFALHHGLNKGALFLAAACAPGASRVRLALFAASALALAAAPFTSGYLAKSLLKDALYGSVPGIVITLLSVSSAATALLLWRAWRIAAADISDAPLHPAWPVLAGAGLVVPWAWAASRGLASAPSASSLWDATWPLLLAAAVVVLARRLRAPAIPEGDIVVPLERAVGAVVGALAAAGRALGSVRPTSGTAPAGPGVPTAPAGPGVPGALVARVESRLRKLPVTGLVLLGVGVAVWLFIRLVTLP